jgi:hypothetical protein
MKESELPVGEAFLDSRQLRLISSYSSYTHNHAVSRIPTYSLYHHASIRIIHNIILPSIPEPN